MVRRALIVRPVSSQLTLWVTPGRSSRRVSRPARSQISWRQSKVIFLSCRYSAPLRSARWARSTGLPTRRWARSEKCYPWCFALLLPLLPLLLLPLLSVSVTQLSRFWSELPAIARTLPRFDRYAAVVPTYSVFSPCQTGQGRTSSLDIRVTCWKYKGIRRDSIFISTIPTPPSGQFPWSIAPITPSRLPMRSPPA